MTSKKKKGRQPPFNSQISRDLAAEIITPEEFIFAMHVGSAAAKQRLVVPNPLSQSFEVDLGDGEIRTFNLADVSENRRALAIREQFGRGTKSMAILARRFALMNLQDDPRIQQWYKPADDAGYVMIHDALFKAAAVEPLRAPWAQSFDPDSFFARVEAFAAAEEAAEKTTPD